MKKYEYSDLFIESSLFDFTAKAKEYVQFENNGINVSRLIADSDAIAEKYGCKKGAYVTLSFDKSIPYSSSADSLTEVVAEQLRACLARRLHDGINVQTKILVVGLGNVDMTADSLGARTVKKITVTGHLCEADKCRIYAFSPGVLGDTGIESARSVRGVVAECSPDAIIAIDSLAAKAPERLISTVQISDNGISPGSGIYNTRREISERTMGVPVIAIGVPTVVDSATLVCGALKSAGIEKLNRDIERALEAQKSFFVAPKDCDLAVRLLSSILADSIDRALAL